MNGNADIHLITLEDYDWYIRFAGEDRLSFDVHSRPKIKLSEILQKIGHPNHFNAQIETNDLHSLMNFAVPEKSLKISHLIQTEFGLETSPKLLRCGDK